MTFVPASAPCVRPSDAERQRVVEALRQAVGTGVLSLEEFEERLSVAYATTTLAELQGLIPWVSRLPHPTQSRYRWLALVTAIATAIAAAVTVIAVGFARDGRRVRYLQPHPEATSTAAPATGSLEAPVVPMQPQCVVAVPFDQQQQELLNVRYELLLPTNVTECIRQARLPLQHLDPAAPLIHVHLDLMLNGDVRVPAGLGTDPRTGNNSGLFTTADNGVIIADATTSHTLGQLFVEWGHPLGDNSIGTLRGRDGRAFNWFVNGVPVSEPNGLVLHDHDEIEMFEDAQGAPINPTRSFNWPADL